MKEYNINEDQYSLRGRVYNFLRENILNGKYKPGENLIEMRLAEELNVSRTPIREAIRQLELEGLVESIPN
jgi:DNA-binding GntR family transcriptional regulator